MKAVVSTLMILLLTAGMLSACQSTPEAINTGEQDTGKTMTAGPGQTVKIGEQDAGKTITLKSGDILVVSLEGNMTTGFNWIPATQEPALLEQVSEPKVTPTSDQPGAPGTIVLQFKATATGQTLLHLDYKRSWEKNIAPLKVFEVSVIVK